MFKFSSPALFRTLSSLTKDPLSRGKENLQILAFCENRESGYPGNFEEKRNQ